MKRSAFAACKLSGAGGNCQGRRLHPLEFAVQYRESLARPGVLQIVRQTILKSLVFFQLHPPPHSSRTRLLPLHHDPGWYTRRGPDNGGAFLVPAFASIIPLRKSSLP